MKHILSRVAILLPALLLGTPALSEPMVWGIQAEQAEYRFGGDTDVAAWDLDALYGNDDLRVVLRSEGEYGIREESFETLENQLRLSTPVSDFFDGVAGVRLDSASGPDRLHGVIGIHGLTRQWFEIDADLFVSDHPSARFEVEYEGLITNRIIIVPSIEIDLPLVDDRALNRGAFGPKLEVGARLSYDVVDRLLSPYVGVHFERTFGRSADLVRAAGEDAGAAFVVIGARMMF
ncbi:MAG: copper resistance protein B [Minwuia sp.]|nr:copper resistance protein B [Minwuia sp.]